MTNLEKFQQIFIESLEIDESQLGADLHTRAWRSGIVLGICN
jgi:hypothetical protein